jgi:uncharacterized lipoprotein
MTTRIIAASVVLLMLAGCDQPPPEKKAADATDYVDRIATMPEGGRNAVFIRALRGAELDCQKVVHSVAAGSYQGMPLWAVTCRDSGPWVIAIGTDGVAQIFTANQVKFVPPAEGAAPPK